MKKIYFLNIIKYKIISCILNFVKDEIISSILRLAKWCVYEYVVEKYPVLGYCIICTIQLIELCRKIHDVVDKLHSLVKMLPYIKLIVYHCFSVQHTLLSKEIVSLLFVIRKDCVEDYVICDSRDIRCCRIERCWCVLQLPLNRSRSPPCKLIATELLWCQCRCIRWL